MATSRRRSGNTKTRKKPGERVGLGGGSVDKHLNKPKKSAWLSIGDGNTEVVRAVDTKRYFKDGYVHPVEFERKDGTTYSMDVRCLDPDDEGNPCPGCRDNLERRYKFWMVVILRGEKKDELRILSGANRLVKALNAKQKKRDLAKRDIEISQEGTGFEVAYEVDWSDEEDTPLSKADKALIEKGDDLFESFEFYTSLRDEDTFFDPPSRDDEDDDEDVGARSKSRGSAFSRERKKGTSKRRRPQVEEDDDDDEDEDEEDEDERPARRKRSTSSKTRKTSSKGGALSGMRSKKSTSSKKPAIKSRRKAR